MEMNIEVRKYNDRDIPAMIPIWNEVVEEAVAFPQESEDSILEKNWFATAFIKHTRQTLEYYSLMPLCQPMFTQNIYMKD